MITPVFAICSSICSGDFTLWWFPFYSQITPSQLFPLLILKCALYATTRRSFSIYSLGNLSHVIYMLLTPKSLSPTPACLNFTTQKASRCQKYKLFQRELFTALAQLIAQQALPCSLASRQPHLPPTSSSWTLEWPFPHFFFSPCFLFM